MIFLPFTLDVIEPKSFWYGLNVFFLLQKSGGG